MAYITNISNTTRQRRQQIKSLQDEFCTFSWGGEDAFENFGAFIINDKKGSLKFYNGPGFSNEYTKPQFDNSGGVLQGVTFNKQSISFTIGVYWISIEDYRKLLQWLHPLRIDYLQFGFDTKYRYDVKLSKLGDSTRWIVGRENGEPRYYTELQLTFELQGTPCAKGIHSYEFRGSHNQDLYWNFTYPADGSVNEVVGTCYLNNETQEFLPSDLDTPLQVYFSLNLKEDYAETNYFFADGGWYAAGSFTKNGGTGTDKDSIETVLLDENLSEFGTGDDQGSVIADAVTNDYPTEYDIKLEALYTYLNKKGVATTDTVQLCFMTLQDVTHFLQDGYSLNFTYVGESGLVFLQSDKQSKGTLLTLQTLSDSGKFLAKQLSSTKFTLPGEFNYPGFYSFRRSSNLGLKLRLTFTKRVFKNNAWNTSKRINESTYTQPILVECYPRTNII